MRMTMGFRGLALIASMLVCACSSTTPNVVQRTPVSLTLEVASNTDFWHHAAESLAQKTPEYKLSVTQAQNPMRRLNAIEERDGRAAICLAPVAHFDFAGSLRGFTPLYCSELDSQHPDDALDNALQVYQSRYIDLAETGMNADFRRHLLETSTPENPVCFSVFSELFAAGVAIPDMLEENYLLACARRIDGKTSWPNLSSSMISGWLRVEAALISNQNHLIADAFRRIASDESKESEVYGIALESYTEALAGKLRQSEVSTLRAIALSDEVGEHFLSRQNALLLSHLVASSESMDGKRLEAIIRALAPKAGWPAIVVDFRTILQVKTCQLAVFIPDVGASLVSACLPWIRMSSRDADDFEMALTFIEHGVYGAPDGDKHIAEDVLSWLQNASISDELKEIRHAFGQRLSGIERLSAAERDALAGL